MLREIKNKQKGGILIEAILALAITIIIITGIVSALISSLNNSTFSKNQNQASGYAQEGLEIARGLKDSDYESFSLLEGEYCLGRGETIISEDAVDFSACMENMGSFTRTIFINANGDDNRGSVVVNRCVADSSVFVASTVYWTDSKCEDEEDLCHKTELNSCFVDLHHVDSI